MSEWIVWWPGVEVQTAWASTEEVIPWRLWVGLEQARRGEGRYLDPSEFEDSDA